MPRKQDELSSLFGIIAGLIGIVFILVGYSITFLEKVNKYHLWKNFWLTFSVLVVVNYAAYTLINTNYDISIGIFIISWLIFIFYWSCCFGDKIQQEKEKRRAEKDEIIRQLAVNTPNCPYCEAPLKKFPMRKTRCPHCGNFIFVRTSPIDNKTYLVCEENIQELEAQWKSYKYIK